MNRPVAAIIEQAGATQRRAADPERTIWVDASAGTGKTKVLTDRVLSLLLAGTSPARLLCLTFTKAAAAEMANRIALDLESWATVDEGELHRKLHELTGADPSDERRRLARQLFARVLDTPGAMKIQTIHAFCQSLLKRFPLEAEIAPHFDVLDERSAAELLVQAREDILNRARAEGGTGLAAALAEITRHVRENEFDELMRMLAAERAHLQRLLVQFGGVEPLIRAVYERLRVDPAVTAAGLRAAGCEDACLELLGLRRALQALGGGTTTDRERAAAIQSWLAAAVSDRVATFETYGQAFLTDKGEIRARLVTKKVAQANPDVEAILQAEAMRLADLRERCNAATIATATAALLRLGAEMLASYAARKRQRALLDYEDLVLKTRDLLRRPGVAPWVLFKLDGGLDHILIDEAQDTNPEQWEVIAALADEFFAGEGARSNTRTVFAVGDPKQSIFSFQRADPVSFDRMRDFFRDRVYRARRDNWDEVPLTISFRSSAAILDAVNAVFAQPAAQNGLFITGGWPHHEPSRVGQAGLVELWPPAEPLDPVPSQPWDLPTERRAGDSPRGRLAQLVAERIAAMIRSGERLESRGRPVVAGDILVLVRRRDALVEELVHELKQRGVPVAGVDRMLLMEQIAVMDLVALGQFLLLPEDDLTLAAVLKSPFVGLTEDELFALAHPRDDRHLWTELKRRSEKNPAFKRAHAVLSRLLAHADFMPPYELYADLLGRGGGRQALLQRLGPDAADPIDEFLNLALAFERAHVPSLQGFLQWLGSGAVEVKRDLDQDAGGQVRIMTVHGAKGLQAPIVFLPDTMQTPRHTARLLWIEGKGGRRLPLWSPRVAYDDTAAAGARDAQRRLDAQEHNRLLYVALTRAEDRLYVCGWHGRQTPAGDCWYHLIAEGITGLAQPAAFDCRAELGAQGWSGQGRRLAAAQTAGPQRESRARRTMRPIPTDLPTWYASPPPAEAPGVRPLTPSRPTGAEPSVRTPVGPDDRLRFRRGLLIHRLLELLPELPPERRPETCRRFLARPVHDLDAAAQAEIARETLRILDDPVFAPLFGPGSRAEVRVVGEIAGARGTAVLSGQVDRLVVTAAEVLVLDYKTNRPPPATEDEVPEIYLRQMSAYRAALRRIYADRRISCALLWTDGPRLMPLSSWLLDRYSP
ncbi:MAG: double-strand break repair helicase AddA [Dongiaceae bacterium]